MARPDKVPWGLLLIAAFAAYPFIPGLETSLLELTGRPIGGEITNLFVFAILALALNVVVGYTGLLHLGIAAFFGIGAYITGILTITRYPFQVGFVPALVISALGAGLISVLISAPMLRLRGDYLALVTLGFGEVVRFTLRNLDEVTDGTKGLNPVPPPALFGADAPWTTDYRWFYFLCLGGLALVLALLWVIERSRLGRAFVAIREDELAATAMGLNAARLKLAAFALAGGLAGFAGCLYATRFAGTSEPDAFDFNRSVTMLSCLILGGLGNRMGVVLGVFLVLGFDTILAPIIDSKIQRAFPGGASVYLTFNGWRMAIFGLTLILVMRFRPEGLFPSSRIAHELHPDTSAVPLAGGKS